MKVIMKKLENILFSKTTYKIGKYLGYSIEITGGLNLVYGITLGDSYTQLSGIAVAYLGTALSRTFKRCEERESEFIESANSQ